MCNVWQEFMYLSFAYVLKMKVSQRILSYFGQISVYLDYKFIQYEICIRQDA